MAASKRRGGYAALMFVNLDNFKPANDRYGHVLLIEAANRLTSCIREVDTVARFGGDEFVVILSDLHADQAEIDDTSHDRRRKNPQPPWRHRIG